MSTTIDSDGLSITPQEFNQLLHHDEEVGIGSNLVASYVSHGTRSPGKSLWVDMLVLLKEASGRELGYYRLGAETLPNRGGSVRDATTPIPLHHIGGSNLLSAEKAIEIALTGHPMHKSPHFASSDKASRKSLGNKHYNPTLRCWVFENN